MKSSRRARCVEGSVVGSRRPLVLAIGSALLLAAPVCTLAATAEAQDTTNAALAPPSLALLPALLPALPGEAAFELAPLEVNYRSEGLDDRRVARPLEALPRVITVLPAELLERRAVTDLRSALRSVSGISLQAGEGNPPGGDMLKIRGFNARDDLNINGVRDGGNYFRDPFFVEQIEVIKGPNSVFAGRGSSGGTINLVTKKPLAEDRTRFELGLGSDALRRSTVDLNRVLPGDQALRVNLMAHAEDVPGRDFVEQSRQGLYAAWAWGLTGPTRVGLDALWIRQDNLPDLGLPYDRLPAGPQGTGSGRIAPVRFANFYGHLDDDEKVDGRQLGLTLEHAFTPDLRLHSTTRQANTELDRIVSAPRFQLLTPGSFAAGATVVGNTKPRDQRDRNFAHQTDLLIGLDTGRVRHDLVLGVDYHDDRIRNRRRPDQNGPRTDLFAPEPRVRPAHPYDGSERSLEQRGHGVYLLNTAALSEALDLHLGLRHDRVRAEAAQRVAPGSPAAAAGQVDQRFARRDSETSWSSGLVYKIAPDLRVFASLGTAFEPSASFDRNVVQLAGGSGAALVNPAFFDAEPQRSQAAELGLRQTLFEDFSLGVSAFRTIKRNARLPNSLPSDANPPSRQRVQGLELNGAGRILPGWRVYAAYSYMQSRVLSAPPGGEFFVGQELGGVPRHSAALFTDIDVGAGFALGGGVQHVGRTVNNVVNPGQVQGVNPAYTVVDLSASWALSERGQLRLNLLNALDERYIAQPAEGSAQGIPGPARRLVLSYRHAF